MVPWLVGSWLLTGGQDAADRGTTRIEEGQAEAPVDHGPRVLCAPIDADLPRGQRGRRVPVRRHYVRLGKDPRAQEGEADTDNP